MSNKDADPPHQSNDEDDALPPAPSVTRRTFFGGVGASTAVAAAASVGLPSFLPVAPANVDWPTVARQSQEAFRVAVNEWIARARIQGGTVSGATAVLSPGSLSSDVNIEARMLDNFSAWRVPPEIAGPIAKVLAVSWNEWAAGFQIQIQGAYPSFVAVPTPTVPPTGAAVSPPLSVGNSAGEPSLSAPVLVNRLNAALRIAPAKNVSAEAAIQNVASWVDGSFRQWKSTVSVTGLVGSGSAQMIAPPYVPVAPVTTGNNWSVGPPLLGPPFGLVAR